MSTIAAALDAALKAAGIPINGVGIGRVDDRKTWRIAFAEGATDKQKADAMAVVDAFDVAAERAKLEPPTLEQRLAALEADVAVVKAAQAKK